MLHGTGIIYLYIYHKCMANVVKTYASPMAQKRGRKEGIFPEGIILEKGQAQKTMQNP